MAKNGKNVKVALLTVLIITAVAVAYFGMLYMAAAPKLNSAQQTSQSGSGQKGAAVLAYTIYFADGTMKTFESQTPYNGQLAVWTDTLYVNNKAITGVQVDCKVTLNSGGVAVSGWSSNVAQRIELYKSGQTQPLISSTASYPNSGTAWGDGETKTVSSISLASGQLEAAIAQYGGSGTYSVQTVDQVSLTVTTQQGSNVQLSGSATGTLVLQYVNEAVMSISVSVPTTPLY